MPGSARGSPLQPSQAAEDRLARHVGSQEPDPEMETFLKICSSGDFCVCLSSTHDASCWLHLSRYLDGVGG